MLTKLSVSEMANLLQAREISAKELLQAFLWKIEQRNCAYNAFSNVPQEYSISIADMADRRLNNGATHPLCGVPYAVKDNIDLSNILTSLGTKSSAKYTPDSNAAIINRLMAVGMVPLGKTHTVEFAFGAWGDNKHFGTPKNPHQVSDDYIPGGSSSGSAVAVSAALAPLALGTDTGGSIRIPAAFCGIYGLRPTYGLLPMVGVRSLSPSLDTVGPMAKNLEDLQMFFFAMQGVSNHHDIESDVKKLNVAYLPPHEFDYLDNKVEKAYIEYITKAKNIVSKIDAIKLPEKISTISRFVEQIIAFEGYTDLQKYMDNKNEEIDSVIRERFFSAKNISNEYYLELLKNKIEITKQISNKLKKYDLLITPATPDTAIPIREIHKANWNPAMFTRFVSFLGWPAITIPVDKDPNGLPIAMQIIAKPFHESMLFNITKKVADISI